MRALLVLILLAVASPALAGPATDDRAPVTVQASPRERLLVWAAVRERKISGVEDQRAMDRAWDALDLDGVRAAFAACMRRLPAPPPGQPDERGATCEESLPAKATPFSIARDDARKLAEWLREGLPGAMVRALGRLTRELEAK